MPAMMAAVSSSPVLVQDAMSPTPMRTVPVSAVVLKVQVGPVVLSVPSLTVAYH